MHPRPISASNHQPSWLSRRPQRLILSLSSKTLTWLLSMLNVSHCFPTPSEFRIAHHLTRCRCYDVRISEILPAHKFLLMFYFIQPTEGSCFGQASQRREALSIKCFLNFCTICGPMFLLLSFLLMCSDFSRLPCTTSYMPFFVR